MTSMKHRIVMPKTLTESKAPDQLHAAYHITNALDVLFLARLSALRTKIPLDLSRPTCPRRFLSEWEGNPGDPERHRENGWVSEGINQAVASWGLEMSCMPWFRFLEYQPHHPGMPQHVDGRNIHPHTGQKSVATMLIYMSDCEANVSEIETGSGSDSGSSSSSGSGSGTTLFIAQKKSLTKKEKRAGMKKPPASILASFPCKRNTALIFPHQWLHAGDPVGNNPKIALRCELIFNTTIDSTSNSKQKLNPLTKDTDTKDTDTKDTASKGVRTATRHHLLLQPLHEYSNFLPAVCQMLNEQWPRSESSRTRWLRNSSPTLPTSYVLTCSNSESGENDVIGHARVAASLRVGGTTSVVSGIVTSLIIHKDHRRQGFGRVLLSLVEERCQTLHGFGRVVLWSNDQVQFYESCGYIKCTPLRVVSAAVSKLGTEGLNSLESMLKTRMRMAPEPELMATTKTEESNSSSAVTSSDASSTATATLKLSEEDTGDGADASMSTWLSKRVIEHFPTYRMDREDVVANIRVQLERQAPSYTIKKTLILLLDVPNEQQIGPCCGIAAMRCMRDYWSSQSVSTDFLHRMLQHDQNDVVHECRGGLGGLVQQKPNSSMLQIAISKQWTIDGEMFNTSRLSMLGANPCGMATRVYNQMPVKRLVELIELGIPIMVPFDKSQQNQEHAVSTDSGGRRAHWGIVRGVVRLLPSNSKVDSGVRWCESTSNTCKNHCFKSTLMTDEVFVVLQHTTHGKVSVVPFEQLLASNAQVDDCVVSDGLGIGWIETDRQLARTWLICWPENKLDLIE